MLVLITKTEQMSFVVVLDELCRDEFCRNELGRSELLFRLVLTHSRINEQILHAAVQT